MAIKACIFDLDGVLVYVNKFHYIGWKRVADELDIPFDTKQHKQFRGVRREQCLEVLLEMGGLNCTEAEKKKLIDLKSRVFTEGLMSLGPNKVFPGALDLLKKLKKEGVQVGLSCSGYHAKKILRLLSISHYFNAIVDGQDFNFVSGDPQQYLENVQKFELEPHEVAVFLANEQSITTANAAGLKTVGIGLESEFPEAHTTMLSFDEMKDDFFESLG